MSRHTLACLLTTARASALVLALATTAVPLPAAAQPMGEPDSSEAGRTPRVRGMDPFAATILQQGCPQSATCRRLVTAIEHSDVIVLVRTRALKNHGGLVFARATRGARYLHVTLGLPETDDRLIAYLAHELQHALEIASEPGIVTVAAMERFYRRRPGAQFEQGVCTPAAQKVTRKVDDELARAKARRSGGIYE